MKFKRSENSTKNNAKKFRRSLPSHTTRSKISIIPESLVNLSRMPSKNVLVGRFLFLYKQGVKSKKERIKKLECELQDLWKKFSFPIIDKKSIIDKLTRLINFYERQRKKGEGLNGLFDVTKKQGVWLTTEDKIFYKKQIETNGSIGYCSESVAPTSSVHPSKRIKYKKNEKNDRNPIVEMMTESENEDEASECEEPPIESEVKRRKRSSTNLASTMLRTGISTKKAEVLSRSLNSEGVDLPTPNQSSIWRRPFRDANKSKNKIKEILSDDQQNFALHFDGKKVNREEFQVICLQSKDTLLKLGCVQCKGQSSKDIFEAIVEKLEEFDCFKQIKLIICDTTSVNSGCKNGVVVRLQQHFESLGLMKPQYLGCQRHILDRILRILMDNTLMQSSKKPSINYPFVDQIIENYAVLQANYTQSNLSLDAETNLGWRDDYKFLCHLCQVFQFYEV